MPSTSPAGGATNAATVGKVAMRLVGAPHTSNWDFVFMLAITWKLDIHIRWLGKKSLFAG